jgi:hypothetical protein
MTCLDATSGSTQSLGALRTVVPATPALQWLEVDSGFWVGSADGNFGGTIERAGRRYGARDALGAPLGSFTDVGSAKLAVSERFAESLSIEALPAGHERVL